MSTEKILTIVEKYTSEFNKTRTKFSSDSSIYEIDAIGVRASSVNDAVQFLQKGINITKTYYISCETIINSVDEICRPMLSENPRSIAVVAVADLLGKIVKNMKDTSTSFDLAINGIDVGHLGVVKPEPSIVSSIVYNFWKDKLMLLPDAANAKKEYAKYVSEKKYSAAKAEDEAKKVAKEKEKIAKEKAKEAARKAKEDKVSLEERYKDANQKYDHLSENSRVMALKVQEVAKCKDILNKLKVSAEAYQTSFMSNLDGFIKNRCNKLKVDIKKFKAESKKLSKEEKLKASEKIKKIKHEIKLTASREYREYQITRCKENIRQQVECFEGELNIYIKSRFSEELITHKCKSLYTDDDVNWESWLKDEINVFERIHGWKTIQDLKTYQGVLDGMIRRNVIKKREKDGKTYYARYDEDDIFEELIWKDKNTTAPQPPDMEFSENDYLAIGSRYLSTR